MAKKRNPPRLGKASAAVVNDPIPTGENAFISMAVSKPLKGNKKRNVGPDDVPLGSAIPHSDPVPLINNNEEDSDDTPL